MKINNTLHQNTKTCGKKLKFFVKRKNDGINYFAFSDTYMKNKVEPFNDELPLKSKFIDK